MAVDTQKRNKRQNEFVKKNYDRFTLTVPKGMREIYTEQAKAHGFKSMNSYINHLLEQDKKSPD